jgi:capsular exopolysaccharide synthesis family protein
MSRIYEALQQPSSGRVVPVTPEGEKAEAVFSEQFRESVWDPNAALQVQPHPFDRDKLPALFSKHAMACEQFRLLATRLQQLQQSRKFKSVLLTSALSGEGKSLVIANLAVSLAQGGQQRVLVVDADLRKPGLSSIFEVNGRPGLREWHQTNRAVSEFICRIPDINVWVLPAGQTIVDPLELLNSPRIADVLTSLTAVFDWVLIDSPPLLPLADAEIISRICDGTMIVVRREKSPKSALKQALERVAPSKMTGLLLNDFPLAASYSYPQCVVHQRPDRPRSGTWVLGLWNWTVNARQRALRFWSIRFGRLARRGA